MPGSSPPGPRLLRVAWHSAGAEWADSVPRTEHESVPDMGQGVTHAGKGDTSCPQEAQSPSCGFDVCHWGACRKGSPQGSAGGGGQASALNSPAGGSGGAGDPTGVIAGAVPSAKESRRIQRKSLSRARLPGTSHFHVLTVAQGGDKHSAKEQKAKQTKHKRGSRAGWAGAGAVGPVS